MVHRLSAATSATATTDDGGLVASAIRSVTDGFTSLFRWDAAAAQAESSGEAIVDERSALQLTTLQAREQQL